MVIERIRQGRTDLVFEWTRQGGAATAADDAGVRLIGWCAYYGDVSAIRHLLDHGEALASLGPNLDLNGAAFHNHWRLCEFLIEHGADPNRPFGEAEESPLHVALSRATGPRQERVVRVLLDAGADPNVRTRADAETGCFMRDVRTRGEAPLHRAAAFAMEATIKLLLDAGACLDARDAHGDSALSWASWHLRPAPILRMLCFVPHCINSAASWSGDHGSGWSGMDAHLLGKPLREP